jgi:hypothetical protein
MVGSGEEWGVGLDLSVNILEARAGKMAVREENEDECTLRNLGTDKCQS